MIRSVRHESWYWVSVISSVSQLWLRRSHVYPFKFFSYLSPSCTLPYAEVISFLLILSSCVINTNFLFMTAFWFPEHVCLRTSKCSRFAFSPRNISLLYGFVNMDRRSTDWSTGHMMLLLSGENLVTTGFSAASRQPATVWRYEVFLWQ